MVAMPLQASAQPKPADARPPHATVSWRAPAECPGERSVVQQVERFLGQPLADATAHPVWIRGLVTKDSTAGYRLMLQMKSAEGMRGRTLQHDDCTKLAEAAALLMAMAIDPERVKVPETSQAIPNETSSPSGSEPEQAARPAAPATSETAPPEEPTPAGIQSVSVGVAGLVGARPPTARAAGTTAADHSRTTVTRSWRPRRSHIGRRTVGLRGPSLKGLRSRSRGRVSARAYPSRRHRA